MSVRTHPRAIGAFVLGAAAIVVAVIIALSAGDWFVAKDRFAVFFPGSVRGLNPGAPVTFRGVKVGEVKDVTAFLTGKKDPFIQIEVVIEFSRKVIEAPPGVTPWTEARGAEMAKRLIESGIRGRMLSQNLLTGQKYIEFDFLPAEPARFAGLSRRYPELPTTATAMEKLGQRGEEVVDRLANLPLGDMLDDVRTALQSVRTLLESPDLRGALGGARRSMEALPAAVGDARATFAEVRRLTSTLDGQVKGTAGEASEAARKLQHALDRTEQSLARLDDTAAGADEARLRTSETLQELSRTLSAVRNLAEYVQRHPEAFVQGKPRVEEKR